MEPDGPNEPKLVPVLPTDSSQIGHIFADRERHLPDTPENRAIIQDTVNESNNLKGLDRFGNQVYTKINPDGSQTWVYVRNGVIQNAGRNSVPLKFKPKYGLGK